LDHPDPGIEDPGGVVGEEGEDCAEFGGASEFVEGEVF
jgi:hypothetical protein